MKPLTVINSLSSQQADAVLANLVSLLDAGKHRNRSAWLLSSSVTAMTRSAVDNGHSPHVILQAQQGINYPGHPQMPGLYSEALGHALASALDVTIH